MKVLFAAALVAGATFVYAGSSTAMPLAPQDNHTLVQIVKDPTCNAPQRNARCKWYGMPGVHKGPKWLRQSQPGTHHHHKKVKHPKHKVHDKMAPGPASAPTPTPQTTAPAPSTPPSTTPQPTTPSAPQ